MLDRVDRPGELVDGLRERGVEVFDDRARGADLAELELIRVEVLEPGGVAKCGRDPDRGGGLEATVVVSGAQLVEETRGVGFERGGERGERVLAFARRL